MKLDLRDHRISIRGAEALANAPARALEELQLYWNAIGPAGAAALAVSTCSPRIRILDLHSNLLGDPGLEALAAVGAAELYQAQIGSELPRDAANDGR